MRSAYGVVIAFVLSGVAGVYFLLPSVPTETYRQGRTGKGTVGPRSPKSDAQPGRSSKSLSHQPSEERRGAESQQDAPSQGEGEGFVEPETEREYWIELQRLQRVDKPRALSLALAGDNWYSDEGEPAEARRAMIVTLLVDLGRMEEARARTRQFIKQYPGSPYRRLAQGVTGIHPRPDSRVHSKSEP